LLFQIISQRYERAPMVITTNRAYKHWSRLQPFTPGKGCQRRGIVASKTSMEYDGQRRAMDHAPTLE
jgi:hypothetical protein